MKFNGTNTITSLREAGLSERNIRQYLKKYHAMERVLLPQAFPEFVPMIRKLKTLGVVTGILTNRWASTDNFYVLRQGGLRFDELDMVITYDPSPRIVKLKKVCGLIRGAPACHASTPLPKPDPRAFAPALPLLRGLPKFPASVWYVGDTLIDLQCAKANSFTFVGVLTGTVRDESVWRENGADIIVPCVRDRK